MNLEIKNQYLPQLFSISKTIQDDIFFPVIPVFNGISILRELHRK